MNKNKILLSVLGLTILSSSLASCTSNFTRTVAKAYESKTQTSTENKDAKEPKNNNNSREQSENPITISTTKSMTNGNKKIDSSIPINPNNNSSDTSKEVSLVESAVDENIGNYKSNVGIYYYNLNTGAEYTLNPDMTFMGASIRKIPVVMAIADDISDGKLSPDTLLYYNKDTDYEEGTGILQNKKTIEPITIKDAMALSIKYSDNIAHKMLLRTTTKSVSQYASEITNSTIVDPQISAKQVGTLLKRLYTNPNNNPQYNYIINLLKDTVFHDRLDKYLPNEIVAHKIGNYYRYYHDGGIVYGKDPYILVIMTKDIGPLQEGAENDDKRLLLDDGAKACELSAKISKAIYKNLGN